MKTTRAIAIGIAIWGLGVASYSASFFVPIMENAEQQANIVLFLAVMPLVWLGSRFYYKKDASTHGHKVGLMFLMTAAALDALITVPLLIIPAGGSYVEFFTAIGFWIIAFEFILVTLLYWVLKVQPSTLSNQNQ